MPGVKPSQVQYLWTVASWALRVFCLGHVVNGNIYEFTETKGESMLTTLVASGDYVHEWKRYRLGRGVEMGDLVVMAKLTDPEARVCKRITGMPGDIVLVDPLSSSDLTYSPQDCVANDGFNKFIRVPEGHVWVTGDNLNLSLDSRSLGCVPMGLIKGKIFAASSSTKGLFGEDGRSFLNTRLIKNTFTDAE